MRHYFQQETLLSWKVGNTDIQKTPIYQLTAAFSFDADGE
jgi:hypothetical protein